MEKRNAFVRKARAAAASILVVLYAAGLIAMLTANVQAGLILWVISTLGGIGLLYWIHTVDRRGGDAPKAEARDASDGGDSEAR